MSVFAWEIRSLGLRLKMDGQLAARLLCSQFLERKGMLAH